MRERGSHRALDPLAKLAARKEQGADVRAVGIERQIARVDLAIVDGHEHEVDVGLRPHRVVREAPAEDRREHRAVGPDLFDQPVQRGRELLADQRQVHGTGFYPESAPSGRFSGSSECAPVSGGTCGAIGDLRLTRHVSSRCPPAAVDRQDPVAHIGHECARGNPGAHGIGARSSLVDPHAVCVTRPQAVGFTYSVSPSPYVQSNESQYAARGESVPSPFTCRPSSRTIGVLS
jgi:hypothetical protein